MTALNQKNRRNGSEVYNSQKLKRLPSGKYTFREKADHLMSVEPTGFTTDDLIRLAEALEAAKKEIERAMILSVHSQQWKHISKAHSILTIAEAKK